MKNKYHLYPEDIGNSLVEFPISGTRYRKTNVKIKWHKLPLLDREGKPQYIRYVTSTLVRLKPKPESKRRRRINRRNERLQSQISAA